MRWLLLSVLLAGGAGLCLLDPVGQKLLGRLAMPIGLLWLGLLGTSLFCAGRRAWAAAAVTAGLWLLCTAAGSQWLGARLMQRLEAGFPPPDLAAAGPYDAVFVCGGGTALRPDGVAQLGSSGDRLLTAATLQRNQRTPVLVTSGSSIPGLDRPRDLAEETAALWQRCGVPAAAIVRLPGPINTSAEIAAYRKLAEERGWKRVAVLSSAWHLRRIAQLCRSEGFATDLLGSDYGGRTDAFSWIDIVPSLGGVCSVQLASWEYLGTAVGR